MAKTIMYVETQPASAEDAAAYHKWYNEVHMKEIVAIDGFKSARRFEPVGHEGPFIAIYELDTDDVDGARDRLGEATRSGQNSPPVGVQLNPPPLIRYFREIAEYNT